MGARDRMTVHEDCRHGNRSPRLLGLRVPGSSLGSVTGRTNAPVSPSPAIFERSNLRSDAKCARTCHCALMRCFCAMRREGTLTLLEVTLVSDGVGELGLDLDKLGVLVVRVGGERLGGKLVNDWWSQLAKFSLSPEDA